MFDTSTWKLSFIVSIEITEMPGGGAHSTLDIRHIESSIFRYSNCPSIVPL